MGEHGARSFATWVSAALHDKSIVVDSRTALVTGSQPEKSSDAPTYAYRSGWHDAGFVVEGDAAQSSLEAFDHTWNGDAYHWTCGNVSWGYDCQKRSYEFPQPSRWWASSSELSRVRAGNST